MTFLILLILQNKNIDFKVLINYKKKRIIYEPKTKEELQDAVNLWCDNKETAFKKYGDNNDWNNDWNVSNSREMRSLFTPLKI